VVPFDDGRERAEEVTGDVTLRTAGRDRVYSHFVQRCSAAARRDWAGLAAFMRAECGGGEKVAVEPAELA